MHVLNKISIDMAKKTTPIIVYAMQGDENSRVIEAHLFSNSSPWNVPENTTPSIAFKNQKDNHKGWYDELPDGSVAISVTGNVVVLTLAPSVVSSAGDVSVAIVFQDEELNQLATFPFLVSVESNPAFGESIVNDYYKYSTMEAVSEAVDAALSELETSKQDFLDKAVEVLEVVKGAATEDAPAIICEAKGEVITASDASNRTPSGMTIYGKTTQNGTPIPGAPVEPESKGASGAINTAVAGKNLISLIDDRVTESKGFTITRDSKSGKLTINGTRTEAGSINIIFKLSDVGLPKIPPGVYTISANNSKAAGDTSSEGSVLIWGMYAGTSNYTTACTLDTINAVKTITVTSFVSQIRVRIGANIAELNNLELFPQFEPGNTATAHEPFKSSQSIAIQTPSGLRGLPTSSIGDYTDEMGQSYYADYKDLARGINGQRIMQTVLDGTKPWTKESNYFHYKLGDYGSVKNGISMCSHLPNENITYYKDRIGIMITNSSAYGSARVYVRVDSQNDMDLDTFKAYMNTNPMTLLYALSTPIETPMSAEEIAAFAALHTNKPNTTVYNDAGADMKLEYVADTKLYIDQKIAAISAAMLNT